MKAETWLIEINNGRPPDRSDYAPRKIGANARKKQTESSKESSKEIVTACQFILMYRTKCATEPPLRHCYLR